MSKRSCNWFEYNWKLRGIPAQFHVDLQFLPEPELFAGKNYLLTAECSMNPSCQSVPERIRIKYVSRKLHSILGEQSRFVGYVDLSDKRLFYYYISDPRLLVGATGFCTSHPGAAVSCSLSEDPEHQTYYMFLCPDAARVQAGNNRLYSIAMAKRGDDIAQPRRISLHLCFPRLGEKSPFLSLAKDSGFAVGDISCNETYDLPFSVVLYAISSLDPEELTEYTTKAILLANGFAGVFERLDSDFIPKKRSR